MERKLVASYRFSNALELLDALSDRYARKELERILAGGWHRLEFREKELPDFKCPCATCIASPRPGTVTDMVIRPETNQETKKENS